MARKKKNNNQQNQLVSEKQKCLQKLWDSFRSACEEYESHVNTICDNSCNKIRKMYADRLKRIPEHIRNMTLTEYMEMQKKQAQTSLIETQRESNVLDSNSMSAIIRQYEKAKFESEKKKTLKKNRIERKRSTSVSICSGVKGFPSTLSNRSRVFSESCLNTPVSKVSAAPCIVTPKFNPRAPLSKACLRRPTAGEVIMSLSGSPLLNLVDDIPDKPGFAVSLGGGRVIKITDDTEISKLEDDFTKKLNEEMMTTLAVAKKKLDKLLPS